MKAGYASLTWVNDKDGREYVCYENKSDEKKSFEQLSEKEQKACENVNQLIGTERW